MFVFQIYSNMVLPLSRADAFTNKFKVVSYCMYKYLSFKLQEWKIYTSSSNHQYLNYTCTISKQETNDLNV